MILLGGSLLGSSNAIIAALADIESLGPLVVIAAAAFISTAALWWIYFWPPHHEAIQGLGSSIRYGYVHYFVFAAAGALSSGIEVEIGVLTGQAVLDGVSASFTVAVPVAVFVLGIWWIALKANADRVVNTVVPLGALVVLLDPVIPNPYNLIATAGVLALMVAVLELRPPVDRSTGLRPGASGSAS